MAHMDFVSVLRYSVLAASAAAMVVGVLVMIGYLVPRYFPEDYRIVMGAVVFLYGAYRFTITYFRQKGMVRRGQD
jgi:putative Ca2+/H+ antiporter (TMEM165/GDT1 family)